MSQVYPSQLEDCSTRSRMRVEGAAGGGMRWKNLYVYIVGSVFIPNSRGSCVDLELSIEDKAVWSLPFLNRLVPNYSHGVFCLHDSFFSDEQGQIL